MASPADMAFNNRLLNVLWYDSPGGPMVVATAFLAFELEIGVDRVPSKLLWNVTLVLLALVLAAAILNALPMMLTLLAVAHAEAELALLVGVLTLVAAAVAKPGFVNLILATETRLRRR